VPHVGHLTVDAYPDATIVPAEPFAHPRRQTAFRMGVLDDRGRVVPGSLLQRSYGPVGFPPDPVTASRLEAREVIYAGHLSWHFGHFILESLARLWFAGQRPDLPIVWSCRPGSEVPPWHAWQRQILETLGLPNEVLLLTEPTRFRAVHVPEPGYRVKDRFHPQHAAFLAVYPRRTRAPDLRVWLSRDDPNAEYRSLHAPRLEEELAKRGWTIVHPERSPVSGQLELLATSRRIAGEQGSAFHLVTLLADVTDLEIDIICRDPTRPVEEQNQNYETIAAARGLRQRLHVIPEERVVAAHGGKVRKDAATITGHLAALGLPPTP
jgi:hypothetical protein